MSDAGPRSYVFGYGSLADADGRLPQRSRVAHAGGLRRRWNVAMDNSVDLPGYKYYVEPESGRRPAVFVVFLNLAEDPGISVNGVILPVSDEELAELDARERNYSRVEISDRVREPVEGRVWTYLGRADARDRYDQGLREGRAVVPAAYKQAVEEGFRALGGEAYNEFLHSTDAPAAPVRVLARRDL